jgi:hypothetical protein
VREDQLHAFLGDARARATVESRRHRHWLARQLGEDRTFVDVCAQIHAGGAVADVTLAGGRTHRGRIVLSTRDVLGIVTMTGATAHVATTAVVGVRAHPPDADRAADPPGREPADAWYVDVTSLDDVVRQLAERRAFVELRTVGGSRHRGRLDGVGHDVLWLAGGLHVPLRTVTEVISRL